MIPAIWMQALALLLTPLPLKAAPHIQVDTIEGRSGVEWSFRQCPCVRATVQVKALGGSWETRSFLLSSEALYQLDQSGESFDRIRDFSSRLHRIGQTDLLWKPAHVGIGFTGIQWGNDPERGYTDIIRTGLYASVNLLLSRHFRFDLRSGADHESLSVNLAPPARNLKLTQSAVFSVKSKYFESFVHASVSPQQQTGFSLSGAQIRASAGAEVTPLQWNDIKLSAGVLGTFETDPFRELFGFVKDRATAQIYISARWEPGNRWEK